MAATINKPQSSHYEWTINWKGGIGAAPRAQQLFRHAENLTDESFETLEAMAKMLLEKDEERRRRNE
jgi:hypothetical protein